MGDARVELDDAGSLGADLLPLWLVAVGARLELAVVDVPAASRDLAGFGWSEGTSATGTGPYGEPPAGRLDSRAHLGCPSGAGPTGTA